jgi:hypothetical protein
MAISITIAVLIFAIIIWYAIRGRAWLKTKPWAQGFFAHVEPIEIFLYNKSETILFARLKMVTGVILAVLTNIGTIDLTPIMPFVPEKYAGIVQTAVNLIPLSLSLVGWADQKLRNGTTQPIEIVAVPDKVVAENPKVAEALAMADATKVEAVAVSNVAVAEAKAA